MEQMNKINADLELIKKAVSEIKIAINLEPELIDKVKQQILEARERISGGKFISNEEMLKEFEIE